MVSYVTAGSHAFVPSGAFSPFDKMDIRAVGVVARLLPQWQTQFVTVKLGFNNKHVRSALEQLQVVLGSSTHFLPISVLTRSGLIRYHAHSNAGLI